MRALASAYIVAAFCVAASLQYTPHKRCELGPLPKELRVEGCKSSPCHMYKGTNLIAQWDFVANANAKKLEPSVRVTVAGTVVKYPYPEKNACKSLSVGACPLKKNDNLTYNLKMPIAKIYPNTDLVIEFSLVDENKNVQVCFEMHGKVMDKPSKDDSSKGSNFLELEENLVEDLVEDLVEGL